MYCGYEEGNWQLGTLYSGYKEGNWQLGACTVAIRKVSDS